jgi:ubiquinol-cytochrome c reductase iron-sulfur subunit
MQASADVLAMASLEVDMSTIKPGNTVTVKWRGKPVFVKHRTAPEIEREQKVALSELRDPEADSDRCKDPEVR